MLASIGSILGAAALVLLVVGLYGTMAAAVIRSRREIGIRLALGARPRSLRALVVARCLLVAGVGLGLGLPLAYAATKSFAHLLYGVQPLDPLVGAVTVAIVLATAAHRRLSPGPPGGTRRSGDRACGLSRLLRLWAHRLRQDASKHECSKDLLT